MTLGGAGCGRRSEAPVGKLRMEPARLELTYPGWREIQVDLTATAAIESADGLVLFVHLLGEPGEVLRTFDHPLPRRWQRGERMRYPVRLFQSALARPLPAGRYPLTAGLYQPGGPRWPLQFEGEEVDRHEYLVAEVEVEEAPLVGPRFEFSPGWSEAEAGSDRQVLARRWLEADAGLTASALDGAGRLWLALRIPPEPAHGGRVLGESSVPMIRVTSTCGDLEVTLSGIGLHELEIPVGATQTQCSLTFEPSFYDQMEGSFERRSGQIEAISWRAEE